MEFPSRANRTCDIAGIHKFPPKSLIHLCGRLTELSADKKTGKLSDASGVLIFQFTSWPVDIKEGDIIEMSGYPGPQFRMRRARILVAGRLPRQESHFGELVNWKRVLRSRCRFDLIRFRSELLRFIREFFYQSGFLEIDAPSLVKAAGMEPHIQPFKVSSSGRENVSPSFLHTSPEFSLKKMLVAGHEKVFYLGHAFRSGESGPVHEPEFMMLEWYRAYDDYRSLMKDCRDLIGFLVDNLSERWESVWRHDRLLGKEWEVISLREIMKETCDFDLRDLEESDQKRMIKVLRKNGISDGQEDWPMDDLFFLIYLNRVEPGLGREAPVILKDYPLWMASLAKKSSDDSHFVERIEVYIDGLELANGFTELNDPDEQMERLKKEQKLRRRLGRTDIPVDDDFIESLRTGMPPSAGIAFGVDRLMMVCCDIADIGEVMCYRNRDSLD